MPVYPPNPITQEAVKPPVKRDYSMWLLGGSIILLVLIIIGGIIFGFYLLRSAGNKTNNNQAPTPPPENFTPPPPVPSRFATDSAVLRLRSDLATLGGQIDSVDLFEPQIAPPAIDLNLQIK